jgi:hypothetical protein
MPQSTSDSWITSLYILAFVRAALILLSILAGTASARNLLDVALGVILGVGAYRRQLWAGYGLILWAGYSVVLAIIAGSLGLFSLLWLVLYTMGTIHLYHSKGFSSFPRFHVWFIIRWGLWLFFLGFLAGFLREFDLPFLRTVLGSTNSSSRFWIIEIAVYALILASQVVAARRKQEWAFEHILAIALAVGLIGGSLEVFLGRPFIESLTSSFYTLVLTFIAWGIAQGLKPQSLDIHKDQGEMMSP